MQSVQLLHSTSSDQLRDNPSGMARGLHSFTRHPHIYPRMEWTILHSVRKHSPDGVARAVWRTSGSAYYSSIDPKRIKGWVGLIGWPIADVFTHISGHPSATGRAWDMESSPVKDRRSTTVQRSLAILSVFHTISWYDIVVTVAIGEWQP